MKNFCRVLSLCVLVFSSPQVRATVTVQTVDGREITGVVDAETDGEQLWIRQQDEQIVLTTSVAWSSILTATQDGKALPLDGLAEVLQSQATPEQQLPYILEPVSYTAPALPLRRRMPRVRSLQVEAFLVNLDRDVEPDGIEVVIAALDVHGQPVPVKASLYARLWGERDQPPGNLVGFEELGSWTQPVMPVDFNDGVASYALRFRTVEPERDVRLRPDAIVNVRLGVFGQGNFEASAPVQIRAFNPLRDRRQQFRGTRFFPGELTGGSRQIKAGRGQTYWGTWAQ